MKKKELGETIFIKVYLIFLFIMSILLFIHKNY